LVVKLSLFDHIYDGVIVFAFEHIREENQKNV